MNKKKKILVCGVGSVGKRHIQNIQRIDKNIDVCVWRKRTKDEDLTDSVELYKDLDKALEASNAVVIATETNLHTKILQDAVAKNKDIYIEKPISNKLEGLEAIQERITKNKLIVEVGCQMRSHPSLLVLKSFLQNIKCEDIYTFRFCVGQRLEYWRSHVDFRKSYSFFKSRGGGALLDLIHEIDLCLWLLGDIKRVFGKLSNLSDQGIMAEDLVNIIVETNSGAVGYIELDMVSPVLRRSLEIVTKRKVLSWNFSSGILESHSKEHAEILFKPDKRFSRNDMFLSTMRHFISRLDNRDMSPSCSFQDGVKALKIVKSIETSNNLGSIVDVSL